MILRRIVELNGVHIYVLPLFFFFLSFLLVEPEFYLLFLQLSFSFSHPIKPFLDFLSNRSLSAWHKAIIKYMMIPNADLVDLT